MKKVLIIIPVFNEEKNLKEILEAIPKNSFADVKIDVLVVNDGSTDRSGPIAKEKGCLTLDHPKRLGYNASVVDGFNFGLENNYDYLLKMDGDGQHDPDYIPIVLKILRREDLPTDFVISSRYLRKIDRRTGFPLERRIVNIMITGLINKITKRNFSDVFCGFFGLKTKILRDMDLKSKGDSYGVELELILKAHFSGAKILEIPHPLIYKKHCSKFVETFGRNHNLGRRLEAYTKIVMDTLKELKISDF